jgi:hypothetical protein
MISCATSVIHTHHSASHYDSKVKRGPRGVAAYDITPQMPTGYLQCFSKVEPPFQVAVVCVNSLMAAPQQPGKVALPRGADAVQAACHEL